jgi:hypothetical protein
MRKLATFILVLMASPLIAQEMPKPGPEHEMLKKQEGNWETVMKAGGMEFKGNATFKMELGGLWLASTMESELFGQKFSGKGIDGYNTNKKKYVSIWVDSMSTGPVTMEGTYDADKKTLTCVGKGPGQDGQDTTFKSVNVYPDNDTIEMTMYIGDTKEPMFTVTYKRKK